MKCHNTTDKQEVIAGLIERITFHSEENGFCVLRIKARGHRDLITVTGHAAIISAGEWITATGIWQNDKNHGLQFKAKHIKVSQPTSLDGIEKYLGSGMVRGIGKVYAKKMVNAFGEKIFDIIEESPDRLREIEGIGDVRTKKITSAWAEQKIIREIMVFLHSHKVSNSRAVRIYKTYGTDAIQVMSDNPYRLAYDIRGIGFKTADTIAMNLGIAKTAMTRVRAGVSYVLSQALNDGHCALPEKELITTSSKTLEVTNDLVQEAINIELTNETIIEDSIREKECIFLAGLYHAEKMIAEYLIKLNSAQLPWPVIDPEKALPWVEKKNNIELAESQKEAVKMALHSKVLVITGGPGVGKTTTLNSILSILRAKSVKILACAPTGRAAKRMSETTGLEAKTIHRLLEFDPVSGKFKHDSDNKLQCDLLVIDEVSMVDTMLMQSVMKALPISSALFLVGDADQLPSVGAGQVLYDVITSETIPVIRLTEVFRQAAKSRIITNAHLINKGKMPELATPGYDTDFYFIACSEPAVAVERIIQMASDRIPAKLGFNPVRDIQVLCPMTRGNIGTQSLNMALQSALNPPGEYSVKRFGWHYSPGDKVMQIENDYDKEVYNGDIGYIIKINNVDEEITIRFDDRNITYIFGELDNITLAYATTIHKSQGSEYPAVIIPVMTQHYPMLHKKLIYTGITRGKKLVIVVGQKKALSITVHNNKGKQRWTKLFEHLKNIYENHSKSDLLN